MLGNLDRMQDRRDEARSRRGLFGVNYSFSSTTIIFPHWCLRVLSAGRVGAKPWAARRAARLGRSEEPGRTDNEAESPLLLRIETLGPSSPMKRSEFMTVNRPHDSSSLVPSGNSGY